MKKRKFSFIGAVVMALAISGCSGVANKLEQNRLAVAEPTSAFSFTRSGSSNTVTSGYSMVLTNYKSNADNYQDKNSSVGLDIGVKKNSGTIWGTAPESISLTVKVGGGSAKDPLTNNLYASLINDDGSSIDGTSTVVTSKVETTTGKNYTISMPTSSNVAGVMLHHEKESSYNIRVYAISMSYTIADNPNINYYTVTFKTLDGVTMGTDTVEEGHVIGNFPNTTKSTDTVNHIRYNFENWYTMPDPENPNINQGTVFNTSSLINSDLILFANYDSIHYNIVTFDSNGGTDVQSQNVDDNGKATKPVDPTKNGYSFAGWYTENDEEFNFSTTTITGDITLHAEWTPIAITTSGVFKKITSVDDLENQAKYLITYNDSVAFNGLLTNLDGTSNTVPVTKEGQYIVKDEGTSSAYFTIYLDNGYIKSASSLYIGRSSYSNGLEFSATGSEDYENDISFDANGNVVISRETGENETVTLRYNKTSGQTRFRYFKSGQEDIQLYKFVNKYTVTFVTNVEATIEPVEVVSGELLTLPDNPTKPADSTHTYSFAGWYTDIGLNTAFNPSAPITSNITLYAKYTSELITNPGSYLSNASVTKTLHASETTVLGDANASVTFSSVMNDLDTLNEHPVAIGDHITLSGNYGTNSPYQNEPKYYSNGNALRFYVDNDLTFTCDQNMSKIEFGFVEGKEVDMVPSTGTFEDGVWTGSATSVTFVPVGTGRAASVSVTYLGPTLGVGSVGLRFGGRMPVSDWANINNNPDWTIQDYGVMLIRKTTLASYGENIHTVEDAFRGGLNVTIRNKGNGDEPFQDGDDYVFTARINITSPNNYGVIFVGSPFIVVNDVYYFLGETECSVNSLANAYTGNDISEDLLDLILAGK